MTTVSITVGATDVSADVMRIEVWRKATEGIGRFTVTVRNTNGVYSNFFAADSLVTITVDNAVLIKGYVDAVQPKVTQSEQTRFLQTLEISGRDYGQDLMNKLYDKVYQPQAADDIIADLLSGAGSEIALTSPHTAPQIYYDSQGAFLVDALREILELIDYDGFVDISKTWNMFPIGSVSSDLTLKSVADASDNNILKLIEHTEKDAYELRNYIIVFGDKVDDGWTEANADGWSGYYSANIVSDYYATSPTTPRKGVAAIKCARGTANNLGLQLTFPRYNHNSLDFSKLGQGELAFQIYLYSNPTNYNIQMPWAVELTDTSGNVIKYKHGESFDTNKWLTASVPIGNYVHIDDNELWETWFYKTGTSFNWLIVSISILANGVQPTGPNIDYILVDALKLPVQMIAVSDQTSGTPYKVRKITLNKRDSCCQKELQAYADSIALKRKDPIDRLSLFARGDIGLIGGVWKWLPGYSVTVNIPAESLNNASYRFMEIHHTIQRLVEFGFDHIVELGMVPATAKLDTQRWSYGTQSDVALLRRMRDRLRYFEQKDIEVRDWYPALPKPWYDIYGKVPYDGMNINLPQHNMLMNCNFEIDSDNDGLPDLWFKHATGSPLPTLTYELTGGLEGSKCVSITLTAAGQHGWWTYGDRYADVDCVNAFPVQGGHAYIVRCQAKSDTGTPKGRISIHWHTADKTYIGSSWIDVTLNSLTWTELELAATAPSNARYGRVSGEFESSLSTTYPQKVFFDAFWLYKQIAWSDALAQIIKKTHLMENLDPGQINLTAGKTLSDWADPSAYMKTDFLNPSMGALRPYQYELTPDDGAEVGGSGINWTLCETVVIPGVPGTKLVLKTVEHKISYISSLKHGKIRSTYQFQSGSETLYYESGWIYYQDVPWEQEINQDEIGPVGDSLTVRWYVRCDADPPPEAVVRCVKRRCKTNAQQIRQNF
jgi:hypothetical protein